MPTTRRTIPATAMAALVETRSASGPATSEGTSDAADTIEASTPNTRPRTLAGVDSTRVVCAVTDVTAYAAPAISATTTTTGSAPNPMPPARSTPSSQPTPASAPVTVPRMSNP